MRTAPSGALPLSSDPIHQKSSVLGRNNTLHKKHSRHRTSTPTTCSPSLSTSPITPRTPALTMMNSCPMTFLFIFYIAAPHLFHHIVVPYVFLSTTTWRNVDVLIGSRREDKNENEICALWVVLRFGQNSNRTVFEFASANQRARSVSCIPIQYHCCLRVFSELAKSCSHGIWLDHQTAQTKPEQQRQPNFATTNKRPQSHQSPLAVSRHLTTSSPFPAREREVCVPTSERRDKKARFCYNIQNIRLTPPHLPQQQSRGPLAGKPPHRPTTPQ